MNKFLLPSVVFLIALSTFAADKIQNRCGWYENPTPANAWLSDKEGQWVISTQGAESAEGEWPEFETEDRKTFVHTNGGSYGYGCVCLQVVVDEKEKRIKKILSSKIKKLKDCRKDKSLKEPENPLK